MSNRLQSVLGCAVALMLPLAAMAADEQRAPSDTSSRSTTTTSAPSNSEIEQLKKMLLDQQRQIDELRTQLAAQKKVTEPETPQSGAPATGPHAAIGEVASIRPVIPLVPKPLTSSTMPAAAAQPAPAEVSVPPHLRIGNAYITPVGFMDMTSVTRSTNHGSGIGTNFGSIPYDHTQAASLTESRLSIQNSRIGARIDTGFHGYNVLGYWESDFLGQLGNPPNGGLAVSSNPYVFRIRLYWVDITKGGWEVLAGQSWSLLTPNRKGISPLPGDIFYSQDIDVNYQAGLVWGRIPGFRLGYHFGSKAAVVLGLENSEPYVGGGNGSSAITAPAAIAGILGSQVNNGASVITAPALHPDIILKAAFDPSPKFHIEFAGVEITNKIANPASAPPFQTVTKAGGAASINLNFELFKGFRLLTNNYWGAGGGRYIFGQAPDFIIRANGGLSLVRAGSTVTGFEATLGKTLVYGYYGGIYIAKNLALDANGKSLIGYGPIASDGQNRTIQEVTFGTNTTLAKDAKWGALNLMFQYSYLQRNPWLAAPGALSNASLSMGFFNLRYTLPGAPPAHMTFQ